MTGDGDLADPLAWQRWWSFNHDPYLSLARLLDQRNRESRGDVDHAAALRAEYRRVAKPVLESFLEEGGPTPVLREVLFTLGQTHDEREFFGIDFSAVARHFLTVDPIELKSAAILTMGILADDEETSLLLSLYRNEPEARELYGGTVFETHRAQAAYALGMIGAATEQRALRRAIVAELLEGLQYPSLDVQVATALALAQVPLSSCDGSVDDEVHLCRGAELSALSTIVLDPERHDWVRAHAATALGRLGAGAFDEEARERVVEVLAWAVHPRTRVDDVVRHGAVLGLTEFADGDKDAPDVEARRWLEILLTHGDQLSRRFALMGLGQCAYRGEFDDKSRSAAQAVLVSQLTRGKKGRKPWAALALGALAYEGLNQGRPVDDELAMALRESLRRTKNPEDAAAYALTLAMLRAEDPNSREAVRRCHAKARTPELRELAALVLGYLGDHESKEVLREEFAEEPARAVPLRLLGDTEVTAELVARLDPESEDLAAQLALVDVLGRTGSPEAFEPLTELLTDEDAGPYLRARAARAIGQLATGDEVHWTAEYANGIGYDMLTWSLESPWGNGMGLFDHR